jgi:hypothetical protein
MIGLITLLQMENVWRRLELERKQALAAVPAPPTPPAA